MKHEIVITIQQNDCVNGKLALHSLCNHMENAANESACSLGAPSELLVSNSVAWALVKMHIDIKRMPECGETITLYTWPVDINRIHIRRDYEMKDAQDNIIMTGVSGWVVISMETRRVIRVPEFIMSNEKLFTHIYAMEPSAFKFPPFGEYPALRTTHANSDDIDINDHVNNVRYVKWIERAAPENIDIKSFEIIYKKEALLGDKIVAKGGWEGEAFLAALCRGDEDIVQARINGIL